MKKGERRAAKPAEKHRSNSIVFKVTDSELSVIADKVRESGQYSIRLPFSKFCIYESIVFTESKKRFINYA